MLSQEPDLLLLSAALSRGGCPVTPVHCELTGASVSKRFLLCSFFSLGRLFTETVNQTSL